MKPVEWPVVIVLVLIAALVAWAVFDDLRTLKADIKAFRTYVMAIPLTNTCPDPGNSTSRLCTYQLKVTEDTDKAKHLYVGIYSPDLYSAAPGVCEKAAKKNRRKGYENLPWECDGPYPDKEDEATEFAFYVDNDTGIKKGGTYQFQNTPYDTHLKKIQDCPCPIKVASR